MGVSGDVPDTAPRPSSQEESSRSGRPLRRTAAFPLLSLLLMPLLSSVGGSTTPGAAPTVTTLTTTGVGTTGGTLNGSVNPNGLATDAMVRVDQVRPGHLRHDIHPGAEGAGASSQPVMAILSGLGSGTTYTTGWLPPTRRDRRRGRSRLHHHVFPSPSGSFPRLRRTMRRTSRWAIPSRSPSTRTWNPPPGGRDHREQRHRESSGSDLVQLHDEDRDLHTRHSVCTAHRLHRDG